MGIRKTTTTFFLCKSQTTAILAQSVEQGISNAQVVGSSPIDGINKIQLNGQVSEWLKEGDCKSSGSAYVGSNPTLPMRI